MEEADVAGEAVAGAGVRRSTLINSLDIGRHTSLRLWAPGARAPRESMA